MKVVTHGISVCIFVVTFLACSSEGGTSASSSSSGSGGGGGGTSASSGSGGAGSGGADVCARGTIEEDLEATGPLAGPGVDPSTGKLAPLPDTAVVSSTYLTLKSEGAAQKRFGELMGPIAEALGSQPGLLAVQLATSTSCVSARTIAVWKDEASMLGFVMGDAHAAAVASVGEVSRGGSVVTSWATTSADEATWELAAKHLAEQEGPFY